MADAFGLDLPGYLYFGGYPGAASLARDPAQWRDYILQSLVEANIERDLLAMTRVDKPALLKRLFALGARCSGQILSYNKMLGQLQDAGTPPRWCATSIYFRMPVCSRDCRDLRSRGPESIESKLNVLNTALMTAGSGYVLQEARSDRTFWGRIVESAVGAHLLNTATSDIRVCYWREEQHEVDFVLQRGQAS